MLLSHNAERTKMEHLILLCHYVASSVLVWLPCAYLYERVVGIAEIYHKEQVALVVITVGSPTLF